MFKTIAFFAVKIISIVVVGIGITLSGVFHVGQPQTTKEVTKSFLGTTTSLVENREQKVSKIKTNKEETASTSVAIEKERTEKEIKKLEKLIAEASVLAKQFSSLIQKEKTPKPAAIPASELNQSVRPAIVNIFCITKREGALDPISGSGVVISKEGVILTNAHIGQYFLLKNYQTENFISCIMRQGDGNSRTFPLDLIFISPAWIKLHAKDISKQNPTGTGQYDYALLSIGNPTDGGKKPEIFPFLPMETKEEHILDNSDVLLAGYPAEFLSEAYLQRDLSLVSSIGDVQSVFTFSDAVSTPDLLGIKGSIVSQKGSSGGAVVSRKTGSLIGMITTSTGEKTTGERELRAISSSYINQVFKEETNVSLQSVLEGNIQSFKQAFAEQMVPSLTKQLEIELDK